MEAAPSFVTVQGLGIDSTPPAGLLRRMLGVAEAPTTILHDVSFRLHVGEHVTLFGPEGAGKSTLLRVLTGSVPATTGTVVVNGAPPTMHKHSAAGYVSAEEGEPRVDSVQAILQAFGTTHGLTNLPARIGVVSEAIGLTTLLDRSAASLSTSERMRVNLARAALSQAPLLLFDDVADQLGVEEFTRIRETVFKGRTLLIATRFTHVAEALQLPILLLHEGTLIHTGTCNEIADSMACPRIVDAWIEGLRYDIFRQLKRHPGVTMVRLLPSSQFSGQRLRIHVRSSRYLPSLYDTISQATLVKVREIPPTLTQILQNLES